MVKQVLFLCTGNYYRSRYAVFNHIAKQENLSWCAVSRGAAERGSPDNVGPISRFAVEALLAKGISPLSALRDPKPCTLADFREAELVIGLKETEHRRLIERRFPEAADRLTYWHVDDVDVAHPRVALAMIDECVGELIVMLKRSAHS